MRQPLLLRSLQILLLASLVASTIVFLAIGVASVAYPYDLSHGEAQLADQAQRAFRGEPLYKSDLNSPPYVVGNYSPLYPLLTGAIAVLGRLPPMQVGRVVSLLSALLAAALVGALASDFSRSRYAGLVALGLFLSHFYVLVWAPLARVDTLALALSLGGLWLVLRGWRSWLSLSVAILLLAGAIYTRQSYLLAAPAAAAIWLWHNDRRRSAWFAGILVSLVSLIFVLLNRWTDGGFFLNAVWVNALGSYALGQVFAQVGLFLLASPVVVVLASAGLLRAVRPLRGEPTAVDHEDERQACLRYGLLPYTVGALLSALTAGKIGADVNYFLEPIAGLSIWAALTLAWWSERWRLRRTAVLILLAAQLLFGLLLGWRVVGTGLLTRWRHIAEYDRLFLRVRAAAQQGPILADDYHGMVLLAGQPIYFQGFEYRQLYTAGKWDPSPLIAEVKSRRFSLILLNGRGTRVFDERWIPAIMEAIDASYCPSESVNNLVLYEPSTTPCAPTP